MQTKLSCEERVNLVFLYAKMNASYRDVAAEFNRLHPARPPLQHTTLQRLITRFKSTGRVDDLPRSGRPHIATGEEACTAVLASLTHSQTISPKIVPSLWYQHDIRLPHLQEISFPSLQGTTYSRAAWG
jgi:transposase